MRWLEDPDSNSGFGNNYDDYDYDYDYEEDNDEAGDNLDLSDASGRATSETLKTDLTIYILLKCFETNFLSATCPHIQ